MTKRLFSVCAVLMLASLLGGCSNKIDGNSVRKNMSPELQSIAMTSEQRKTTQAHAWDTTGRQVWDDLDKIFFMDHASRLSRYPVP